MATRPALLLVVALQLAPWLATAQTCPGSPALTADAAMAVAAAWTPNVVELGSTSETPFWSCCTFAPVEAFQECSNAYSMWSITLAYTCSGSCGAAMPPSDGGIGASANGFADSRVSRGFAFRYNTDSSAWEVESAALYASDWCGARVW